jgi:hypothetical protein
MMQLFGAECVRNWIDWEKRLEAQNRNTAAVKRDFLDKGRNSFVILNRGPRIEMDARKDTSTSRERGLTRQSTALTLQRVKKVAMCAQHFSRRCA